MPIGDDLSNMLSVSEVAALLHIHSNTLRAWSNDGVIKSYRISKRGDRRFKPEDVSIFLAKLNGNEQT